jgi:hypothetical protein
MGGSEIKLVDCVSKSEFVAGGWYVAQSLRGSIGSQNGPGALPRFVLCGVLRMSSKVILWNKVVIEEAWC